MAYALNAQRFLAFALSAAALLWGALVGAPVLGLWVAVWVIGITCTAAGAVVHETLLNRSADRTIPPLDGRGREVMVSGLGYLGVAMVAGWFPVVLTTALLSAAMADFFAGHYVVVSQRRIGSITS